MHSNGKANETECVRLKPYPRPIFDYNWNKNAVFEVCLSNFYLFILFDGSQE